MTSTIVCFLLLFISRIVLGVATPPHIVLIVVDDLGWNDVGYNNPVLNTPTIDRLAGNGVKLLNYYVANHCVPSRNMLMTGRHAIHLGLGSGVIGYHPRGLPLDETTLGEKLKTAGYSTHIIGKWHCGFFSDRYLPHNRGFDTFFGYLGPGIDHYTYIERNMPNLRKNDVCVVSQYGGNFSTFVYATEGVDIINAHDQSKPLFLYLSFALVHAPLQAPESYVKQYETTILNEDRRIFAGMTSCVDEAIANITHALERNDMLKNSVIVFTSDNGGAIANSAGNNWPLRGGKGSNWEGGVRAVAFVYSDLLPQESRGTENTGLMHITDWFPTLVKLAGGNPYGKKKLYGVDQWNMILGLDKSHRGDVLITLESTTHANIHYKTGLFVNNAFDITTTAAIKMGKWKLLTGSPGFTYDNYWFNSDQQAIEDPDYDVRRLVRLYNLDEDPNETTEISDQHHDI
uniref:Arylsulfatase I-like n=1 Tax=Saccoglossus kowalevskii TaxID=10224 RepID=A0ABM0MRH8_SACKO